VSTGAVNEVPCKLIR